MQCETAEIIHNLLFSEKWDTERKRVGGIIAEI
jgi:hypothetical protein